MATRGATANRVFNHGVQYLRAASPEFGKVLEEWTRAGVTREWDGQMARLTSSLVAVNVQPTFKRYVDTAGMRAIGQHLSNGLTVHTEQTIHHVERTGAEHTGAGWILHGPHAGTSGVFDRVILAVPAPQAVAVMGAHDPLASELAEVFMSPRWTLMAGLAAASGLAFDAAQVEGSPITWMMRTLGDARSAECWTMHLSAEWSRMHLELDRDSVARELDAEVRRVLKVPSLAHLQAHRWRYALASAPLGKACVVDKTRGLALAGDWCLGDRVEHAWQSGIAVANAIA